MRYRDGRRSLCLSSQSGCPLTCTFCATGQMAFGRNLTASEILDQALHFRRIGPVDHAVFMGMGEPMLNLDEVLAAARRLPDVGITHRRTTVSTVGWLPGLRRFVDEVDEPIRLALSLHAADDDLRSQIMPVNDRYPVRDVVAECRRYVALRRRRVYVEYVMLAGVNDSREQARARRGTARRRRLQGEPHPVQPDRLGVHGLGSRPRRALQGRARARTRAGDRAAHAWARHRGGVRAARVGAETEDGGRPVTDLLDAPSPAVLATYRKDGTRAPEPRLVPPRRRRVRGRDREGRRQAAPPRTGPALLARRLRGRAAVPRRRGARGGRDRRVRRERDPRRNRRPLPRRRARPPLRGGTDDARRPAPPPG